LSYVELTLDYLHETLLKSVYFSQKKCKGAFSVRHTQCTLVLPVSQLKTQQMMTSQIR